MSVCSPIGVLSDCVVLFNVFEFSNPSLNPKPCGMDVMKRERPAFTFHPFHVSALSRFSSFTLRAPQGLLRTYVHT